MGLAIFGINGQLEKALSDQRPAIILQCINEMSPGVRKPTIWVPTRSDTNQFVQSQKMVGGWKFWTKKVEKLYYPCSENKGRADQLRSHCEADLRLCFRLCKLSVFPCGGSNDNNHTDLEQLRCYFKLFIIDIQNSKQTLKKRYF